MNHRQSSGKLLVTLLVSIALVATALLFVAYQKPIYDWIRVQQFRPDTTVSSLATDSGMSNHGRYLFYTGEPTLATAEVFNQSCGGHEHSTATLGCYAMGRIYVYDIENDELAGIEEVTAAHEMLHAAYERLSEADKNHVNQAITHYLPTLERDKAFVERMKVYAKLSEADRLNELHSVIGTEVKELSDELETYYRHYFTDRSRVTALHAQYSGVFAKLQAKSETLAAEYNTIAAARNRLVEESNREYQQLSADMAAFNRGPRTDAARAAELNTRAASYNARLDAVRQQVATYDSRLNAIKTELDQIAVHTQELQDSIDSSSRPAQEVHGG